MLWYQFAGRLIVALLVGALVGAEWQWRQRTAGLRTNCLVAMGSAMFVMMGGLIGGDSSQGRVASYVVSGIGFLGGGVILAAAYVRRTEARGREPTGPPPLSSRLSGLSVRR